MRDVLNFPEKCHFRLSRQKWDRSKVRIFCWRMRQFVDPPVKLLIRDLGLKLETDQGPQPFIQSQLKLQFINQKFTLKLSLMEVIKKRELQKKNSRNKIKNNQIQETSTRQKMHCKIERHDRMCTSKNWKCK